MVCLFLGWADSSWAALLPVQTSSPTPGQMGVSLTPTLQWQQVSGANAYEIIIKDYGGSIFWDKFINNVASKQLPAEVLQMEKSYEWCIRGVKTSTTLLPDTIYTYAQVNALGIDDVSPPCVANSSFYDETKPGEYGLFSTAQAPTTLRAPTISSPTGVTVFPLKLQWSSVGSSFKYQWKIVGTKTETLANGDIVITALSGLPSGQTSGTQVDVADPSNSLSILKKYAYTWRVRTCTADYRGDWASAPFTLTLKKFHLVSPGDDTPTATRVKLDWEDVPGATSYKVVGEGFDPVTISDPTKSETTISGLTLDQIYKWYVIAYREGEGFVSEEQNWSFTPRVGIAPPTTPTTPTGIPVPEISSPANGATDISANATLSWRLPSGQSLPAGGSFKGLIWEDIDGGTAANFTTPRGTMSWRPGTNGFTLYSGVPYRWKVQVCKNATECGDYASGSFTVSPAAPLPSGAIPTPEINTPMRGAIDVPSNISLSWTLPAGQSLPAGGSFKGMIFTFTDDGGPSANFTTRLLSWQPSTNGFRLQPSIPYGWSVQVCKNATECGDYASGSFTVSSTALPPTAPKLISPPDKATNVSLKPTLKWDPVSGADDYGIEISGPSSMNILSSNPQITLGENGVDYLSPGSYSWRVRAIIGGVDYWSNPYSFTAKNAVSGGGGLFSVSAECQSEAVTDCPANQICNPLKYKSVECLVEAIIIFLMKLAIPVATIMFVIAGGIFVTSAGNPEKFKLAKRVMIYTAIGFAVILVASGLIRVLQSLLGG